MNELEHLHTQLERLLDMERLPDARRVLARAFEHDPNHPENLLFAARIEHSAENYDEAHRYLSLVLSQKPGERRARALMFGVLSEKRRYAEAEQVILELLRESPANGTYYAMYAHLMFQTLNLEKARALVNEALRYSPENTQARVLDVFLHLSHEHTEAASGRLSQLVSKDPEAESVAWAMISVLTNQHRYSEALAVARQLLRHRPTDPSLVQTVVELRLLSHWTMLPLRPVMRFGFGGSIAVWAIGVGGMLTLRLVSATAASAFTAIYLGYILYSWVYPPLLRKWLLRRGI